MFTKYFANKAKQMKRLSAALLLDVKGLYDPITHQVTLETLEAAEFGGRIFLWV